MARQVANERNQRGLRISSALAALALVLGGFILYAERTLFDSERFAERAASVLEDPAVEAQLGSLIADAAIEQVPDSIAARPLIEGAATAIVGSAPVRALFEAAVEDVHRTAISRDGDTLLLALQDIGIVLREALAQAAPQVAEQVPRGLDATLIDADDSAAERLGADIAQLIEAARVLHLVLFAAAALLAVLAVRRSPTRLEALRALSFAVAIAALGGIVVLRLGEALLSSGLDEQAATAVSVIYEAFLSDLRHQLLILAGLGVVVGAATHNTREPLTARQLLGRGVARINWTPESTLGRGVRGLALVALGVAAIADRALTLDLIALVIGVLIAWVGISELLRLLAAPAAELNARASAAERRSIRPRVVGAALLACTMVIAIGVASNPEVRQTLREVRGCNGHPELCDRPLDEVVFAATHNSMSAATNPGWLFAQHSDSMGAQLRAGYRALLIDIYYGVPSDGRVATDLERTPVDASKLDDTLSPDAIAATERIRARVGFDADGESGTYLCHGFCEPGAIDAVTALTEVSDFLVANPAEVLILSIEDAVEPADTVAALEGAGLDRWIYRGELDPMPTLAELIKADKRVIVMAERFGGPGTGLRDQFAITEETPFTFKQVSELRARASCDPNRGPADAPFFLMNHWIDTSPAPKPTNARKVNEKRFILDRVAECEKVRGRVPSLIAVDFFAEGDPVGAVDRLNGVE